MKIKTWKKNIFITGALLSFFFLLGLSTARADCSTENITITSTNIDVAGDYVASAELNGFPTYLSTDYKLEYKVYGGPMNPGLKWWLTKKTDDGIAYKNTTLLGDYFTNDEYTASASFSVCGSPLVGGFFFQTPPASDLGAGVGSMSMDVFGSFSGYLLLVAGLLVGVWITQKIIDFIPKEDKADKFADREIARSKRDRKEEKRIMATLD